jgi:hypothetical protein
MPGYGDIYNSGGNEAGGAAGSGGNQHAATTAEYSNDPVYQWLSQSGWVSGEKDGNAARANLAQYLKNIGYKPGGSMADFMSAVQKGDGTDYGKHFASWVQGQSGALQKLQWGSGSGAGAGGAGGSQPPGTDWYSNAMQRISDFATKMSTVDPNDPLAKSLGNIAYGQGAGAVGAAGFGSGGISATAGQRAYDDSQTRYKMERQQLAERALASLQGGALQARGQNLQQQQFEQNFGLQQAGFQNQLAQQAYASQLGQNQALGSAIGGVAGTVAGAYFGVPGLGQAGSQLGGGIGGYATGGYKPQNVTGYSGAGGGQSYGGGQSSYGFTNY